MPNNETKVLDEDGAILLTSNIKTLADATYPANAAVASPYNSSISYIVGSYCLHNGLLYTHKRTKSYKFDLSADAYES